MTEHALVKDGEIVRFEDFDETPTLAPNKGAWLPVVVEGGEASADPTKRLVETVEAERVLREWVDRPLAELKSEKQEAIRALRWQRETGGIVVGGVPIRTDEKSQAKLNGAVSLFGLDPAMTEISSWEAVPGVFVSLSKAQIDGIAVAVGAHVQACFNRSRVLSEAVAAAADKAALDAIDITAGWPE